ncbi:MAG: hypothetical protein K6L75_13395 [Cellvibrionaceae bacterium]
MTALNEKYFFPVLAAIIFSLMSVSVSSQDDSNCSQLRQFTFSWQFTDGCQMKPRGGTSKGAGLQLDKSEHAGWLAIQEAGISNLEKDRRAILAMAGGYRTTFDFIEVAGFEKNFTPDPPYQSWGTEYVYVVENRNDFISLQHIMVMEYVGEDGQTKETMVQKHWRQDWRYEKKNLMVYGGDEERHREKHSKHEVKGKWAQSVFQVDDSPRYEALGEWQHENGVSTWISDKTWRPVPRRERSFRKDYDVLIGTNRHTITPTGWIQEEENFKTVLNQDKEVKKYLSKEIGVNRYERIMNFDFSLGDKYWEKTKFFWSAVREAWREIENNKKQFILKSSVAKTPLFISFFQKASEIENSNEPATYQDKEKYKQWSLDVLSEYIVELED